MSNQPETDNEVFIGARALKEQINLILPTYKLLLEQIEQMRSVAGNDLNNRREHNNTIGIFGARGTGKTSALYTIMQELEKNNNANIILPIIEPDNFGENTKIMGSIVGLLSDAVEKELGEIKKVKSSEKKNKLPEYFNNCIFKENNPLKVKRDELIEYHLYTENEYRNLLTHNFDDTATHIKKSSYLLTPDIKFKEKLMNLIDFLIKTRKELINCNETPLIFIFIDDIDLKTTKCKELIDSILQYSNHPNVVTLLSGDYELLMEAITFALISDENLKDSNITPNFRIDSETKIFDRKKYLANEYLKKIIPPARRHNVVKWNIKTIPNFAFGDKTLAVKLYELLGKNNFFGYINNEKIVPIKYCYSIFDKTPRGLVNVYYHIHQIVQTININLQNNEGLFKNAKSLIDTIIISSAELADEQKRFFQECLLWGDSPESTFIDYKKMIQYEAVLDETKKIHYKLNKNSFNFFIICELLKQLLGDISYNEADYYKFRNMILRSIFLDPKDKMAGCEIDAEGNFINKEAFYIYNMVIEFARNMNLKTALTFLEHLTSNEFGQYYGYSFVDENKYIKDRNIFVSISNVVKQDSDSTLLKDLYLRSYDDKNYYLTQTIKFLNNICSTTQEFLISEKIYKPMLRKTFQTDDKGTNLDEIIRILLINTLTVIQSQDSQEIEEKLKELTKESSYYKQCTTIRNFYAKLQEYTQMSDKRRIERLKNNINKIIDKLDEDIFNLISNNIGFKLAVSNNEAFLKAKVEFLNGYSGSEKTVYSKIKGKVTGADYYNYEYSITRISNNYNSIFKSIEDLSNNARVWFGRQEAIKFLEALKQQFYFDLDLFKDMIPLIYELGKYFIYTNPEIEEDNEFEECKKFMRNKLDEAFKEAMGDVETDLEEMGSNLEDDEKES